MQGAVPVEVAQLLAHPRERPRREQRVVLVAELAEAWNRLLEELPRARVVPLLDDHLCQQELRERDRPGIVERARNRERLLGARPRRLGVAILERKCGCAVQCRCARGCRTRIGGERAFRTSATFDEVTAHAPEPPERAREPQDELVLARALEPVVSRA